MKIVIDARFWGPTHSGLGIYTRELVQNLAEIDDKNQYVLLLRKESADKTKLPANFSQLIVEVNPYTIAEQIALPLILYKQAADLVHFPSINVPIFYFGKFVVTIHDLIKHQSRGVATTTHHPIQYWFKYLVYLVLMNIVVSRAKQIIVPSKHVQKELIDKFKIDSSKTTVTYEAATLPANVSRKFDFPDHFAIYTGNAYPHKNLETLVSVWPKVFEQTKMALVISSGRGVFSSRIQGTIKKTNAGRSVQYLGFLSDAQLASAYSQATLYVFPTLLEGFGLPGLDAMKFNLPLVCSDIPVLREIYGTAAHYFNPKDPTDMQNKIIEVATNKDLQQKLIAAGKKQVKKYSWEKMTRQTLQIYQQSLSSH